jgi:DNA-binding NarL/FixJ family response regulator
MARPTPSERGETGISLYDMAARITHLVLARDEAVGILLSGPRTRSIEAAIRVLLDAPDAGEPGGPARSAKEAETIHRNDKLAPPVAITRKRLGVKMVWREGDPEADNAAPEMRQLVTKGASKAEIHDYVLASAAMVLYGVRAGQSSRQIAMSTGIPYQTVKKYVSAAMKEAGVSSRSEL